MVWVSFRVEHGAAVPGYRARTLNVRMEEARQLMTRHDADGEDRTPLPHDLPSHQADAESPVPDPWDPELSESESDGPDETVPDTDQAGTGRTGGQKAAGFRTDQPVPHEPVD